jgi:hypothetical protein
MKASSICALLACGWIPAAAQSLVEASDIPAMREAFEAAKGAPRFHCTIIPVRPELTYSFRFVAGYSVEFPLEQFRGPGHILQIHSRIAPGGREPVYLTTTYALPELPPSKIVGQVSGTFLVGEGAYGADVLVEDDLHRVCTGEWRMEARRSGNERELREVTPAGAVEEPGADDSATLPIPDREVRKLTILLSAAPSAPNRAKLTTGEVQTLVDSLTAVLEQLPAQSVRLVVFNAGQMAEVFRADSFSAAGVGKVRALLNDLQLAVVDYRTLKNRGSPAQWIGNLIGTELADADKPDTVLILGQRAMLASEIPAQAIERASALPPVVYLQYEPKVSFRPGTYAIAGGTGSPSRGVPVANDPSEFASVWELPASVEHFVARLKGTTIPIRTPHNLAEALRRVDSRVAKVATPKPATPIASPPPPDPPRAAPKVADPPSQTKLSDGVEPVELLMRLRDRVLSYTRALPNYTCVETVRRRRYEPVAGRATRSCDKLLANMERPELSSALALSTTDYLRLDVALSPQREIFSWAGASRFEEREVDEFIPEGAIGTGAFAAYLVNIFGARRPQYFYEGPTTVEGREALRYSFIVPREESSYRVKGHREWVVTGYTATLFVDPKSAELISLELRTDELPAATDMCETDTSMQYEVVRLGAGDYLLPKIARQLFISRDGAEAENTMGFSACREYQAESRVDFGERSGQSAERRGGAGATALDLPPGLPVTIELTAAVDGQQAAAGDRIEGRLAKAVRDEKQQRTLLPEGAVVHGRLMRVETRQASGPQTTIVFRWETIEVGGASVPLALVPNRATSDLKAPARGLRQRGVILELPAPGEGRYALIHFPADRATLAAGDRSEWFTAKPD